MHLVSGILLACYFITFFSQIHFGGLDNFLEPVKPVHSSQNFSGCLSNLWYGSLNVIQGVSQSETCLTTHGDITPGACQVIHNI